MAKKKPSKKQTEAKAPKENLSHSLFRDGGVISIFLGEFESDEEMETYFAETFPVDFGFVIDPRDAPETCVSSDMPFVDDLLDGFSWSKDFVEPVARALAKDGWHRCSAAAVFYNFRYDPKAYLLYNAWATLCFVGTFQVKDKVWTPARQA
jgi:hypothetical protein